MSDDSPVKDISGSLDLTDIVPEFPEHLRHPCSLETYKLTLQMLLAKGNELAKRHGRSVADMEGWRWIVADCIAWGEEHLKEAAYSEAEKQFKLERNTLYNMVWVARRFPISLRRETKLKWSHFKELARIQDEQLREAMMYRAKMGSGGPNADPLTVRRLRELVDRELKKSKPKEPRPKAGEKKIVLLLDKETYRALKLISKVRRDAERKADPTQLDADLVVRFNPNRLAAEWFNKYCKEHEKQIWADVRVAEAVLKGWPNTKKKPKQLSKKRAEKETRKPALAAGASTPETLPVSEQPSRASNGTSPISAMPTPALLHAFLGRCRDITHNQLPKAGCLLPSGGPLLLKYLLGSTGKPAYQQLTTAEWESLLAPLDHAGNPEGMLQFLKEAVGELERKEHPEEVSRPA
jgi:hypothetical protein